MKFVRTFVLLAAVATALAPFAAAQAPDTTPPTLVRGEIDGRTLTLYFNEALDEDSVPEARAFWTYQEHLLCSHNPHGIPSGWGLPGFRDVCAHTCFASGAVEISGKKVVVSGMSRAVSGRRVWLYEYRSSRAVNKLRDVAGNEVRYIRPFAYSLDNVTAPSVWVMTVSNTVLTMTFENKLDTSSKPAASAFAVTVGDNPAALATTDPVEIAGVTLKLNLASAAAAGATVRVSYTKPSSNPLQDPSGNQVASYQVTGVGDRDASPQCGMAAGTRAAGFQAPGYRAAGIFSRAAAPLCLPKATNVEVSSEPVGDDTYARGESIGVRLTFSEAVTVTGTPRVKLDFSSSDGDEQWAEYAGGSGTKRLEFAYSVAQDDSSSAGVAVLANTLALNGGTIESVSDAGEDAALAHKGLAHNRNHKVYGGRRATVSAAAVVSDAGGDDTYAAGDTVQVALTFGEAVEVDTEGGAPRLKLDLGGDDGTGERWAAYESGSGTTALTFAWTAAAPDESAAGVAVLADTLELDGGAIRSVATDAAAVLGHAGLAHDPAHKVDAAPPRLLRGEVDGGTMKLFFNEALDAGATGGRFMVDLSTEILWSNFDATGVVSVEDSVVTVGMGAGNPRAEVGRLTRNQVLYIRRADGADGAGGALRDLAGNLVKAPEVLPIGDGVEWRYVRIALENVTGVPRVTGVAVVSDAGSDATYALGERVRVAVTFSAAVEVDSAGGTPALTVDLDPAESGEKRALYRSGSGTDTLVFVYQVVEPNLATEGVAVLADTLALDGGTIRAAAAQVDAALSHAGRDHDPAHKVDWRLAPVPVAVTGVSVVSGAGADQTYGLGDTIQVRVTFDGPVDVTGTPRLKIDMDPAEWGEKWAAYASGGGTDSLTFVHTVVEPNISTQGIAVLENTLELAGGTIGADGADANLAHDGLGHDANHKVDWRTAGGQPPLTARFVDVPASHGGRDSAFSFGLVFSEALVRKFSSATLRTEALQATNATVTRTKRVVRGDNRRWTVTVQPTSGAEVTVSLPATTDCTATGALCTPDGRKLSSAVSATVKAPGPPSVSGVSVVSSPASGDTYLLGETIRIRATFSEAVTVTGTPTLSIDMDPAEWGEKQAAYASGSGTSSLIFAHTVVEPNLSRQGIAVLADTLTLSGGTIRTAGGTDAALGHTGLGHASGHKVDWRPALSVADARAREGADEAVEFEVSLSRAFTGAGHSVTVDYATSDGTATAGEDYTAASGTLTFAAGETTKTVSVPVLDDSHDEGHETFSLRLSNVVGARAGDLEATGTIENTDAMPRAWLARFGRTLAEQVVDAVGARLAARGGGGAQARLAGQELSAGGLDADESARLADQELARWLAGTPEQPRTMSGGELLAGSAFSVTSAAAEDRPAAALWGRGGWSRFEGREGSLSVEGEVTTALLGAEVDSGAWLGGVMLSHARGDGSYRAAAGAGTVASTLTAVHPYVGVDLSERLTAWAAGGLGLGGLTLTPEGAAALETDLSLVLAALGARGRLVEPTAGSGFSLAIETDAYWVRTGSAEASGLAEAQADATRIRLGLDGGYRIGLGRGGTVEPTVAVGVRHDGGDAETGYGMDVGGGLAWSAPALGLSAQVAARGLLTEEFDGFRDLGLSGSLAWDPDPASERGASLTVTQTVGAAATGGSRALLGRPTLAGLAATGDGLDSRRLELKFGYGFPAFGERLTATPELGVALSDTAREFRLGWKLGLARSATSSFDLGVEAIRTEPVNDSGPQHGIRLKLDARY